MSQTPHPDKVARTAPAFYVTPPQGISPSLLLLALVLAAGFAVPVLYALRGSHQGIASSRGQGGRPGSASGLGTGTSSDDDDDPSRVDTIYLGGPDEAPVATRPAGKPSTVHPFVVVKLPRSGEAIGQIPDSAAGHLLYNWMAAFNSKDVNAAGTALPGTQESAAERAQIELRKETGGFSLESAKEVEPGVLVFRLHDQGASPTEVLGTLRVRPGSNPAVIGSFSLRAVEPLPTLKTAP